MQPPQGSSLGDKLKALGIKPASQLAQPAPQPGTAIHDVLTGELRATPAGEVFVHSEDFPQDHRHGGAPIGLSAPLDMLASWAQDARLRAIPPEALAFLDTETSGLAGGTGTYAFLIGAGRFIKGRFHLEQFFMRDPAEEGAVLEGLAEFLAPCQALVTFNGKAFDAPLLVTRYRLQRAPVPFEGFAHIDLLPLARRLWRDRLPSRTLKYLEEHVLSAPRSSEEVPGYEIPWLYFDYLRSGDARPLKGVFYHNAMDVVAMAALLNHTAGMLAEPFDPRLEHGQDVIALARLNEDLDRWETAARLYERGLQMELPEADFWQAVRRLAVLQKRRGDLSTALSLWEQAAAEGHLYAHVELAKYHEHTRRDAAAALAWTESALEHLTQDQALPEFMQAHWRQELNHRLERLRNKLGRG